MLLRTRRDFGRLASWLTAFAVLTVLGSAGCENTPAPPPPNVETPSQVTQADFTNGGFETGNLNGWTVTSKLAASGNNATTGIPVFPPTTLADLGLNGNGANLTSVVGVGIPNGLTNPDSLRTPYTPPTGSGSSTKAVVINEQGNNTNANVLQQSLTIVASDVDPSDGKVHIRFAIAPVLDNPTHNPNQQPYFFVELTNTTKSVQLFHTFNFANQPGVSWKNATGNNAVQYTDWQAFDIAPGSAGIGIGDTVLATIVAAGCAFTAHWGEVYVDQFGTTFPAPNVNVSAPSSVQANTDLTYTVLAKNGGSGPATNVIVDFTTPMLADNANPVVSAATTFTSISASGATCTTPAVGSGGTITCNVGTLSPGGSYSFTVTVHVPATTGMTAPVYVNEGSYDIKSDQTTVLNGGLVQTLVTTSLPTDLQATLSDGVAAVTWGQADTYTLVVKNNGPNTANGVAIVDARPAQLTAATWTCAGTSGGVCGAASGSGNINTTANLPVGGVVTYTINATVTGGPATGSFTYQATATPPAGMVQSVSFHNTGVDTDSAATAAASFALTVNKDAAGTGQGSIVSSPAAISCGTACTTASATFASGTSVSLSAIAPPGQTFVGWSGACSGTVTPCTLTISAATSVTARFDAPVLSGAVGTTSNGGLLTVRPGDTADYTVTLNVPNNTNAGITLTDTFPSDFSYVTSTTPVITGTMTCSVSPCTAPTISAASNVESFNFGAVTCTTAAGCKIVFTVRGRVGTTATRGESIVNVIDLVGSPSVNLPALTVIEPNLAISRSAAPSTGLNRLQTSTVTVTVTNTGAADSTAVTAALSFPIPANTTAQNYVAGTCPAATPVLVGANATFTFPAATTFAAGSTCTFTYQLLIGAAAPQFGTITAAAGTATSQSITGASPPAKTYTTTDAGFTLTMAGNPNGTACTAANQCTSGICDPANGLCGYANGDGPCTAGTATTVCQSGACSTTGLCKPAGGCLADLDCSAAQFCDGTTSACLAKLPNGSLLVTPDSLHNNGVCSVAVGAAECTSGSCSSSSNRCVAAGGCFIDADCAAGNFCNGSTNTCTAKLANGVALVNPDTLHANGTCTVANGTAECTSGTCGTASNKCVPSGGSGCASDLDCTGGKFCNGATLTCTAKLANLVALVNPDPLHNNGTCSVAIGVTECVSATCGTASNKCIPAGGCAADGDCAAGKFCNGTTNACVNKLANGVALVNPDSLHNNGTCSVAVGTAECTSGACGTSSNKCVPSGGCAVDADCASGQFCNGTTSACTAKLANGVALVNPDSLHNNGTCSAAIGTAECTSGACGTSSNKCIPSGGCAADGDCASGQFCNGTTLACVAKLANGVALVNPDSLHNNGTCSVAIGTAECTSGACGTSSNKCVPSGGCAADGDCASGQFCNGATLACTPKLANGVALANPDPLHNNGTCSGPVGIAECVSGACGGSNKCVPAGGCAADSDCASGQFCNGSTLTCLSKLANGVALASPDPLHNNGVCTGPVGVAECASGACSASNKCVPPGGAGCAADTDCSGAQFCNGATLTCTPKLANGIALVNPDPIHGNGACTGPVGAAECASSVCDADNKCGFANGDGACTSGTAGTVCRSGACGSDTKCGLADGDGTCNAGNAGTVCRSGACGASSGECVPTGGCITDADCGGGRYCNTPTKACVNTLPNGSPIPTVAGHAPVISGTCSAQVATIVCASGACDTNANVCGINIGDGTCTTSAQCNSGVCVTSSGANSGKCEPCITNTTCSGVTPACNTTTNQCVACTATTLTACTGNTPACNVATNSCVPCNGDNGASGAEMCPTSANPYCAVGGACTKCTTSADCLLGTHPGAICNTTTGACGALCTVDADCSAQQWCDNATGANFGGTCAAKIVNGQPVPAGAPINGACTTQVGTRVCVSTVCDMGDNDCGEPNSRPCTTASVCRSSVCNTTDNKCGDPNGTACTTPSTCRSGICDADSKCGEPNGEACTNDVDCRSGICDADGKCGELNGEPCTNANPIECRSGVCFTDNACGIPIGQTCTTDASCRNGACLGGKCTATCTQDAQCPVGEYCDATSSVCAPAAPNGAQPGGANCTRGAECLSGVCNADGKCGDPDGTACTTPSTCRGASCVANVCGPALPGGSTCTTGAQCASGVCDTDGKCGIAIGEPCSVPSQCRSGICDTTGTCKAACTVDNDCVTTTYCNAGACAPSAPNGQKPGGVNCDRGAECLSNVCDKDGACGSVNGEACGTPITCRSAVCDGKDGKCGFANGDGPCTSGSQTTICRSAVCDTKDNLCGLANGDGPCTTNDGCRSGQCTGGTCTSGSVDGGVTDGGNDGGIDASVPVKDAGVDASEEDAGLDATVPVSDAGHTPDASAPVDATTPDSGPTTDNGEIRGGGCTCRMTESSSNDAPWAALGALALCSVLVGRGSRRSSRRGADGDSHRSH